MTIINILVCGQPKPGHELQYHLAMKHRVIASELKLQYRWHPCAYYRADKIWFRALRRMHQHGMDLVLE